MIRFVPEIMSRVCQTSEDQFRGADLEFSKINSAIAILCDLITIDLSLYGYQHVAE